MSSQDLQLNRAAEVLRAFAHPLRLQILLLLSEHGELQVNELRSSLMIAQSMVSHHLAKMKDKGILSSHRRGQAVYYSLADTTLINIFRLLLP